MTGGTTNFLRRRGGPLTDDLVRAPGSFGLGQVPARLRPAATTELVCGYCSTGCSLTAHLDAEGEAMNLTADPHYPVNLGMACPKGWEALAPLDAPDRATTPLLRRPGGGRRAVSWEGAMEVFVRGFRAVQAEHGAAAAAFLGTGQIVTEELAFLGALAKFGMGMVHGDGNTRQCMATSVAAYKESFGFDAPPYTYADFEASDVIIFVGANPCIAHPILWQRVRSNGNDPEVLVVDPRRTETAAAATAHYAIRPKSDLVLFYGLAHLLIRDGRVDDDFIREHTAGFSAFAQAVADYRPGRVAAATGLSEEEIEGFAETIGRGKRVSFWWTMGVNQGHEATRTAQAIINLALMTGNVGRPGTGANSITGQCNAMGSRLFSNTTNLLGGHAFEDAAHRAKVAGVLGIDTGRIPDRPSWPYPRIVEGIERGEIRALWVVATNGAHSWIDQDRFAAALDKLDFLVVQDLYADTETARRADLFLPAAGWGEKEGTFINSERRVGRVRKIRRAPGDALADFQIFRLVSHNWGCADRFAGWTSPEAVFRTLQELSRGQPCDISGIGGYAHLEHEGGVQWPHPEGAPPPARERRLFANGRFFHPDGRARFVWAEPRPVPETPDDDFPFWLLTGRGSSAQWHTQTRTARSAILRKLYPQEIYVELHADDAARVGVAEGDPVRVRSRRGELVAAAAVTNTVRPGQVFIPMHYPETNRLTLSAFDLHSFQPAYKSCAVALAPARAKPG